MFQSLVQLTGLFCRTVFKKLAWIIIAWSLFYFFIVFLCFKIQTGLQFETIRLIAKPSNVRIGLAAIKIYFPNATIHSGLFQYKTDLLTLEINLFKLFSNKPYLILDFSGGSLDVDFNKENVWGFIKTIGNSFTNSKNRLRPRKITFNNVSLAKNLGKITMLYKSPKNNAWQASLEFLSNNSKQISSLSLNKKPNFLDLELLTNNKTIAKANLIKISPCQWILCSNAKTSLENGFKLNFNGNKLTINHYKENKWLGSINVPEKTCNFACKIDKLKPFLPTLNDYQMDANLEIRCISGNSSLMAFLKYQKPNDKAHQITICSSKNFTYTKISNSMFFVHNLLPMPQNEIVDFSHYGQLKSSIFADNKEIAFDIEGKNLKIENKLCDNKINFVKLVGSIDFPTKFINLDHWQMCFDKGFVNLDGSFCKLKKEQIKPEILFLKGHCNEFQLAMPKYCCLSIDSSFKFLFQEDKSFFHCDITLDHGTIKRGPWSQAIAIDQGFKLTWPELNFTAKMNNKNPIEVVDQNSSMELNLDLSCSGILNKKELGNYDFKVFPKGKIDICKGYFKILDNCFSIKNGSVILNQKFNFKPIVDLKATCKVKKHLVELNLFGPMERPFLNFYSNTLLSHDQITTIIFSGQEAQAENKIMSIFPAFLVDQLNKQMSKDHQPNKIIKKLGNALAIARNPTTNMKIIPCLIESKIEKIGAAISYSPSPRFYANLKKDILNKDCLIIDAEYLLGENSSVSFSRNKNQTIKGELEFKFNF